MEATVIIGYIGIMEKKMETTIRGIMEKKMETTIIGLYRNYKVYRKRKWKLL